MCHQKILRKQLLQFQMPLFSVTFEDKKIIQIKILYLILLKLLLGGDWEINKYEFVKESKSILDC